jgi:hypothetical protein
LIELESPEVGERGVSRSKVVEGHAHTHVAQAAQVPDAVGLVAEKRGLGDLDLQTIRREARRHERGEHRRREGALSELGCGDVDRDARAALPACRVAAGAVGRRRVYLVFFFR